MNWGIPYFICYPFSQKKLRKLPSALLFFLPTFTLPAHEPEAYKGWCPKAAGMGEINDDQTPFFLNG